MSDNNFKQLVAEKETFTVKPATNFITANIMLHFEGPRWATNVYTSVP
jgi:hypothetical protein